MSWRSFILASSLLAASSTAPRLAPAQSRVRETGTFQVSQHVLWIRGTDQGVVQLFVARGFRDALARPHNLNPDAILSWSDSLAKLRAAQRAAGKEIVVSTNGLASDGTVLQRQVGGRSPGLSITLGGGETLKLIEAATPAFTVALEEAVRATREFSRSSGVASGDGVPAQEVTPVAVATSAREEPPALPPAEPTLVTPVTSAPAAPAKPSVPLPALPAASNEPQTPPAAPTESGEQKRRDSVATTPATTLEQPPAEVKANTRTAAPEPVRKRSPAKASVAAKAAARPMQKKVTAATSEPAREPVRDAPSPPDSSLVATGPKQDTIRNDGTRVEEATTMAVAPSAREEPRAPPAETTLVKRPGAVETTQATSLEQPPAAKKADVRIVAPEPVRKRPPAKAPVAAKAEARPVQKKVTTATPEPVPEPVRGTTPAPPVVATAPRPASAPSDKKIDLPLGELVIPAALLGDRNAQVQYCYRQVGFKYDSQLAGQLIVRVTLGDGGVVTDVKVIRRNWDGVSAGEVESCIRALIREWTFAANDPSVAVGTTEFTFTFKP